MIEVGQTLTRNEILLTGANGFLGKVVLGLLLDRYPEFKHLHVLLRPTRHLSARERFYSETLRSPALAAVARNRGSEFMNGKITVWAGDVARSDCGLEPEGRETLKGRVRLIINCAGRVEFFPPLDECFSANVDGADHVATLAQELQAKLLHVSTCYVCGEADGLVEETEPILGFYPRRKGPDDKSFDHTEELRYCRERIRQIYDSEAKGAHRPVTSTDHGGAKDIVLRLVALGKQRAEHWGWVNTYTFAKSLGEQIIASRTGLDYTIVRPAIIESSLRFPFPGWIEGGRTAAPLVLMALGGFKDWPLRKNTPLEVVPVDLAASAILVVGTMLLNGRQTSVYQLGTADVNPVLLEDIATLLCAEARKRGTRDRDRPFGLALIDPPRRVRFLSEKKARAQRTRLQERINRAESVVSGMRRVFETARLPGKGPLSAWASALRTLSLQTMFREKTLEQFLPFMLHNRYIFESENIRTAYSRISEKDRRLIPWDPEQIDWEQYWTSNQVQGIQKWVQPEAVREWAFRL